MKTPEQKYQNDPHYRALVDMIRGQITLANFTPSEIREACVFACIQHEMQSVSHRYVIPHNVNQSLETLEKWIKAKPGECITL